MDGMRMRGTLLSSLIIFAASSLATAEMLVTDPLLTIRHDGILSAALSPDGLLVATGATDNLVKIRNHVGTLMRTVGHGGQFEQGVFAIAFSADGSKLVTGGGDATARIWDVATGSPLLVISGHEGDETVHAVAFSPDGSKVLIGSNMDTELYDASTGLLIRDFKDPRFPDGLVSFRASAVSFSKDGSKVLASSEDTWIGCMWDAATGQSIRTFGDDTRLVASTLWLTSDGTKLLSGGDRVRFWNTATGAVQYTFSGGTFGGLALSPDESQVLAGGTSRIVLWDAMTGRVLRQYGSGNADDGNNVFYVGFGGQRLMSARQDGTATLWWAGGWPGDATQDCSVNILDLIVIRNLAHQPASTGNNWLADVNCDGRINILDLLFARNHLRNKCQSIAD